MSMTLDQVKACIDTFKVADLNVARQAVLSLAKSYADYITRQHHLPGTGIDGNCPICKAPVKIWEDFNDGRGSEYEYDPPLARQSEGVSEEDVESVGKALYIYWEDVNEQAKNAYRKKVRAALTAVWHNRPAQYVQMPTGWENPAQEKAEPVKSFQSGVEAWMGECFIPSPYSNMTERSDRLLEEVLELLQSTGYDRNRVATLVDYVYGRPAGDTEQEVGGVMCTLAAFCWIAGMNMHEAGDKELARITHPAVMAKIRAKQEAKNALHFDTPLRGHASPSERVRVPDGWKLVPLIGTTVKADHPITYLNPDEYFDVHEIQIGSTGVSVRGKNTCWLGLGLISAAPEADHHD